MRSNWAFDREDKSYYNFYPSAERAIYRAELAFQNVPTFHALTVK